MTRFISHDPHVEPSRIAWEFNLNLPRDRIPGFLELLHTHAMAHGGDALYVPDHKGKSTRVRYDWPVNTGLRELKDGLLVARRVLAKGALRLAGRKLLGASRRAVRLALEQRRAHVGDETEFFRLGVVLTVAEGDLRSCQAYASTEEHVRDRLATAPDFSAGTKAYLQEQLLTAIRTAANGGGGRDIQNRHVVFHVHIMSPPFFSERVELAGGVTILPTVIARDGFPPNQRVSAVVVTAPAASQEVAKTRGLGRAAALCALATLSRPGLLTSAQLQWSERYPQPDLSQVADPIVIPLDEYYPRHLPLARKDAEQSGGRMGERIRSVWKAYCALSSEDNELFTRALFAHFAAREMAGKQPTLAIVANVAALNALASQRVEDCPGAVTCTCGRSLQPHKETGEVRAIVDLISELWETAPEGRKLLHDRLSRVYGEQRSAFVHGAVFRYRETDSSHVLPSAMPTADEYVSDLFFYERDLDGCECLTRQVLLRWLEERSGVPLDRKLLDFERPHLPEHPWQFVWSVTDIMSSMRL